MLELPSLNRLTRIQLSDRILKHVFAGTKVGPKILRLLLVRANSAL